MSDPFGIKDAQKKANNRLDRQESSAREARADEIQDRLSRATDQIFRVFGRNASLGGGQSRPGILG